MIQFFLFVFIIGFLLAIGTSLIFTRYNMNLSASKSDFEHLAESAIQKFRIVVDKEYTADVTKKRSESILLSAKCILK